MKLHPVLSQRTRLVAEPLARISHFRAYFFAEERTMPNSQTIALQRRAVWVGCGLIIQTLNFIDISFMGSNPDWSRPEVVLLDALLPLVLTLLSFLALGMAFRPIKPLCPARYRVTGWQRLVLVLLIPVAITGCVFCWDTVAESFSPPRYMNDGTSLSLNAGMLLLHGQNPYADSNIVAVAQHFAIEPSWTTPLRENRFAGRLDYPSTTELQAAFAHALKTGDTREFESKVSYPALSFLILIPFLVLPHHNVFLFYLISYLLLVVIAWRSARIEMRAWVLLLGIANVPMWTSVLGGNLDIFYVLLLVLAWLQREHRWRSALLLGLALASKQIAWFFLPFYIILIWRTKGRREAIWRALISGGLMMAINLPFLLWNPQAWLAGILAPVVDPMFPLGIGLINLSIAHVIPFLPFLLYPLLEYGTLCGACVLYWRICRRHPEAAMLLAVIPLFFAWRSLPSYFCCTAYPLFVVLVARPPALKRIPQLPLIDEEIRIPVAEHG